MLIYATKRFKTNSLIRTTMEKLEKVENKIAAGNLTKESEEAAKLYAQDLKYDLIEMRKT